MSTPTNNPHYKPTNITVSPLKLGGGVIASKYIFDQHGTRREFWLGCQDNGKPIWWRFSGAKPHTSQVTQADREALAQVSIHFFNIDDAVPCIEIGKPLLHPDTHTEEIEATAQSDEAWRLYGVQY